MNRPKKVIIERNCLTGCLFEINREVNFIHYLTFITFNHNVDFISMGLYKISVSIIYWLGPVESQDKKIIEISRDHFANTRSAASQELDRLLYNKIAELTRQGFKWRHEKWDVHHI